MKHGTRDSGLSHAALDAVSRDLKARKVEALLFPGGTQPLRLLEVGSGSGLLSSYFASRGHEVIAVDVVDVRTSSEGYSFELVPGVELPFKDGEFDAVISNHVIEHVGDKERQHQHLTELLRVLRPGGVGYLAVPSRWMLVEPHYRVWFLSWMPRPMAGSLLRLVGKGEEYDCWPRGPVEMKRMLRSAGIAFRQLTDVAIEAMLELEGPQLPAWLRRVPLGLWRRAAWLFPTLIYRLKKPDSQLRQVRE